MYAANMLSMIHCSPTHYTPEDWDGFVKLLTDTVITHREELLHIAESKSSPDGKERKIRKRYPEEFRFILQHWFPGLRHSDYTIHYVVRPFTVEQAKQVFQSNPKNLSIEEMFRIARTYPADSPEYNKIFMTAVLLNPEHPVANLNAACILLSQGDTKGASLYLDKAGELPKRPFARYHANAERELYRSGEPAAQSGRGRTAPSR